MSFLCSPVSFSQSQQKVERDEWLETLGRILLSISTGDPTVITSLDGARLLERYPPEGISMSDWARLFLAVRERDYRGGYEMPTETTDAMPGSELKIHILAQRFSRGQSLFHPQDARMKGEETDESDCTRSHSMRATRGEGSGTGNHQ